MVKIDELKEKIKRYLQEKCQLDIASCYAVCKDLSDDYWDEWRNVDDISEQNTEDFSDFEQPLQIQHPTLNPAIQQNQTSQKPQLPNIKSPDLTIQVT